MHCGFNLLYADDSLLVVDKPAGLLAVPGLGEAGADNLATRVQQSYPDARTVHRLDMATSGLMLMAHGADMQRALSRLFEQRAVHKGYGAIVEGTLIQQAGCIDAPLAADWPQRPRQKVDLVHGKQALTRWQVAPGAAPEGCTRLQLEPVTGRTHQLRVHLMSIGHPIRGDTLYGSQPERYSRMLLHACELRFTHPLSGRHCHFSSETPF